jgi:AraC-like DNA-binding protein/mannose-6-phosphate isomerase-like protein (cupin superfamily)
MPRSADLTLEEIALAEVAELVGQVADVPVTLNRDVVHGAWGESLRHTDFRSLYLAERGEGRHIVDGIAYEVTRGDVYLMSAGSEHHFADARRLSLHAVHFSDDVFEADVWTTLASVPGFDSLFLGATPSRRLHLSPAAYVEIARDLAELWAEWRSASPAGGLLVRTHLLRMLVRLARFAADELPPLLPSSPAPRYQDEVVATALRSIELGYGGRLQVRDLAATAYLSPDRFTQVFAAVTGRTPRDYIGDVRIERATTLLVTTAISISQIALACGFRDGPHFSRSFRSRTGRSPREFRAAAQAREGS